MRCAGLPPRHAADRGSSHPPRGARVSRPRNTRWAGLAIVTCLLFLCSLPASGGELIPTPEFSDHGIPIAMPAEPDSGLWAWINVAVLAGALALASYFTLVTRSRRNLLLLSIASLIWFGFVRNGCICPIGATQNVTLSLFDSTYLIPATVILLFVLPLVFTLFFGRTFCAAVCPLGAAQEVVALRGMQVPSWLDHTLGLIPFIYLGTAVAFAADGTAFVICRYDPFVAFFRMQGDVNMLIFGVCVLVLGIFIGRPYCRYLCPYGAVLGLLSRLSKWHATIPPEQCIQCHLCEDSCPYGAIQAPTVNLPPAAKPAARRRLASMLLLVPVLIAVGAGFGLLLAVPLARMDPDFRLAEQIRQEDMARSEDQAKKLEDVRLAERIRQEDMGQVQETTDASDAFRSSGRPAAELYEQAIEIRRRYRTLGGWLGAWVGLVIGIKLVSLSIRRKRTDYQPDRARCVSCGRCYWYCPGEQVRLGLISDVSELVDLDKPKAEQEQATH